MINESRFQMISGDSKEITIRVTSANGSPVDMTGATGIFTIAEVKSPTPEQIITQKNSTTVDAVGGIVIVKLNPEDTAGYSGIFPFDYQVQLQNGDRLTAALGWVTVEADVTNTEQVKAPNGQLAATVDLTMFYTKDETYTKDEIDTKMSSAGVGLAINDTTPSTTDVYSSQKVEDTFLKQSGGAVTGNIYPVTPNTLTLGTLENPFADVFIGPNSLYVDGQKIVSSVETTIDITTDIDKHLSINTSGAGTTRLASGKEVILWSQQTINMQAMGNINALSDGDVVFKTTELGGDIEFQTLNAINDINFKGAGRINLQATDINFTSTPKVNGIEVAKTTEIPDISVKADKVDTYTKTEVDGLVASSSGSGGSSIDDVTPSTTTTYSSSKIENELSNKANVGHAHVVSDVTGLQSALDGKQPVGDYATNTALDGKANVGDSYTKLESDSNYAAKTHAHTEYASTVHSHAISEVTGLQLELDGKATTTHGHAIADITNLQTTLDGKAPSGHNHDSVYAVIGHNHDGVYAPSTHSHSQANELPFTHVDFATTTTDVHLALIELMAEVKSLKQRVSDLETEVNGANTSADTTTNNSI